MKGFQENNKYFGLWMNMFEEFEEAALTSDEFDDEFQDENVGMKRVFPFN